jgi:hypothetical protein
MTNRNDYSRVTGTWPRLPWPYRHPRLFGAAIIIGILAVSSALAASIEIEVTVPLLWPAAGTIGTGVLVYSAWRRAGMERQATVAAAGRKTLPLGIRVDSALAGSASDLIGRDERDAVIELLNERYATSHLDDEEYGQRHTAVLWAKRRGELRPTVEGLKW